MSSPLNQAPLKQSSFLIIGAGSWGTALALLLARNGHDVLLWSHEAAHRQTLEQDRSNQRYLPNFNFPAPIHICHDLVPALKTQEHILIAVPSHAFGSILKTIAPHWPKNKGVVWATKGLDPDSGQFLSELVEKYLGKDCPKALLTGPSFAKEVATEQPTAVTIVGHPAAFVSALQACFQSKFFRVYTGDDLIGAQLGGAVKNILAVAVGVAEGLGYGTNTKAGLMTRGLAEMIRFGEKLGAKAETLIGLSGLGDLILTCSDKQSRNLRFGILVGQGKDFKSACKEIGQVVEGVQTTKTIYALAKKLNVEMPITEQMYQVLEENKPPKDAVLALISRVSQREHSS